MASPSSDSIHPFSLSIPAATLDDLQTRLRLTRWPDEEPVSDWSQGVPLAAIQDLVSYWQTEYDWRRCEALLNSYPQFTTTIDGVDIYFLHIQSAQKNAIPMLITHGWPGSVLEFRHVIDELVNPALSQDVPAFHLVIPALPGYAFSGKPTEPGWDHRRVARAWAELMRRLGYAEAEGGWVAQGGDWGSYVVASLGHQAPMGLKAVHFNSIYFEPRKEVHFPARDAKGVERAMRLDAWRDTSGHGGYGLQQSTRPQTLGYALADSPVGQAAWIYEKYRDWTDRRHVSGETGDDFVLNKDEMLDTIMLYWLSNSATASARFYWENRPNNTTAWQTDSSIQVGVSWFGGDNSFAPREWCERYYKNIVYWNETEKGGHFAAWEQPDLFVKEIRDWHSNVR